MKYLNLSLALVLLSFNAFADTVSIPTTYSTNGSVTSTNLNGNFQALAAKINGGLDNNNADTTNGYRFFETKSTLPTVGNQGRTVFLTTDNSLNLDSGSTWVKAVTVSSPSVGQVPVYSGSAWVATTPTTEPVGVIYMWGTTTPPTNYLLCDGSAVSRTTYASLYAVIGTTFGTGDGSTTFNLPNFKARNPIGYNSSNTKFDTMGETGGEETHTLDISEIPAHTHSLANEASNNVGSLTSNFRTVAASSGTTATGSAGGGGAHNVLDPYLTINFIIKYQ